MDSHVNKISSALNALLASIVEVLRSRADGDGKSALDLGRRVSQAAVLETFHYRLQLYQAACDQAQEFLEGARHQLFADTLWDDARGPPSGGLSSETTPGAMLSVAKMEEFNEAVKALAAELHHAPAGIPGVVTQAVSTGQAAVQLEQAGIEHPGLLK